MADVNEKIVQRYFELKGYMVTTNLKYMIKKKSSGESDIDLAVLRINPPDRAIIEVKGWHTETFSMSYFKNVKSDDYRSRLLHFVRSEALQAAKAFFKSNDFRKILVVPELSPRDREQIIKMLKEQHDVEVLEFTPILQYVISMTKENKNYRDSEFQQTIRLMKAYGFLKE